MKHTFLDIATAVSIATGVPRGSVMAVLYCGLKLGAAPTASRLRAEAENAMAAVSGIPAERFETIFSFLSNDATE